jgi:hypothetical protein
VRSRVKRVQTPTMTINTEAVQSNAKLPGIQTVMPTGGVVFGFILVSVYMVMAWVPLYNSGRSKQVLGQL